MSVITSRTVSISPLSTSARSSSRVSGTRHSYTASGMDRKRPVIGISAYDVPVDFGQWKDMRCVLVPEGYVRSVVAAGGVPVLIPPTEVAPEILDDLDAMVFTGGSDINPAVYGQEPHPESSGFYDHRDAAELELMRAALGTGDACARHLPRDAASERRPRRRPRSSTSRATPTRGRPGRTPGTR